MQIFSEETIKRYAKEYCNCVLSPDKDVPEDHKYEVTYQDLEDLVFGAMTNYCVRQAEYILMISKKNLKLQ